MIKTVNLAGLVILSVLLLAGPTVNAEIFTVELPEFLGPLVENGTTKTASFDFGTSFLQIDDVRLQLSGTCTMGSAHGDGTWFPEDQWIDVRPGFEPRMDPGDGWWGMGLTVSESQFLLEESFESGSGATWDFLLDGTDEATLRFRWGFGIDGWVIVTTPTADITEAHLIVDGVVPEPATVLLLGLGGLILRS